jgi:hypothetical protein
MPNACTVHSIQNIYKTLRLDFGHHVPDGLSDIVAISNHANVSVIDEFEYVIGSAKHRDEAGSFLKQLPLTQ